MLFTYAVQVSLEEGMGAGGLVIIDTLNRAAPGADENSSVDRGNIIASAKKLQNLIGGLVLFVHHSGKDKFKGLRGHSSLYAALDSAIEVIKTDTRREWCVAKSKDDVTGNVYPFKLEIVKVGFIEGEESKAAKVLKRNICFEKCDFALKSNRISVYFSLPLLVSIRKYLNKCMNALSFKEKRSNPIKCVE